MSATRRGRTAITGPRTLLLGAAVSAVGCGLLVGAEPITVEGAGGGNTGGFGGTGAPTSSSGGGMGGTGTGGTGDGGSGAGGATGTGGAGTGGTTGTGGSGTGGMGGGPTCAASLDPVWSLSFTGMADQIVNDIAVDNAGNVVLVGSISGTSDFGGSCPMPANGPCPMDSLGGKDVVIVKLDSMGNPTWTKVTGDSDVLQEATGVATDTQGNIVVTGRFKGSLNFGGNTLTSVSSSTYDIFVAKFAPDGTHLWSKRFGDADDQIAEAVTVDAAGNVILSGYFLGSVYFTSNGMNTLSTAGIYDIFVAKLDPAGEHIWSMSFGDSADQRALGVAVDSGNNILVTGRCTGTLSFGGPNLNCGPLQPDLFVVKFDPQGGHLWSKSFGDGNDADIKEGKSVAADPSGDVLVTGRFRGTLDFINGDTPLMAASSLSDVFVTKLAGATGTALWSRKFGASGDQIGESVAADANGNVIVSGAMAGSISFGGKVLASAGATDMFVISYDTSGMAIDGKRYGDSSVQTGIVAKINTNNDIILAGNHQGAVDVGCMNNATSVDAYDVIVTRLKHP